MTDSVLIVDDSLTVRMDLVKAFEENALHPVACATAAEARELLARVQVQAVVLDVFLPDVDGVDFLAELRGSEEHRTKPILLLSTEADVADRVRGMRSGADAYIGKPYDLGYLVAKTRELMRARRLTLPAPDDTPPTVLLIEDSITFRMRLKEQLEADGYQVICAETGEEGLRVAADRRPDLMVVDGGLPGIDGATVIRRVRLDAALRDIPCMLLTASTDRETELAVLDAGADAFVRKHEDTAVLLAKLAIIRRQSTATSLMDETSSLHGPKQVLAVDDSATYLATIEDSLRADGYEVALAHSGEEALELLATQTVDCILLDLLMPGINGLETCQRIKAVPLARDIPLIMVTSTDHPTALLDALESGADDYIRKSDDLEILKARVRAQMRRRQFQDDNRRIREDLFTKGVKAREVTAARELAQTRLALVKALEWRNSELEAFSDSVSHDLRGPLQVVEGFSEVLLEKYTGGMDETGQAFLRRINVAAHRMAELVGALLKLAEASGAELATEQVDLSVMAGEVGEELRRNDTDRVGRFDVEAGMSVTANPHLVRALLANLLGNAWKFTKFTDTAEIEVGSRCDGDEKIYFVRDNGAGFSTEDSQAPFQPFVRLHDSRAFPGTGIGLATVYRIVTRHGGRIWATSDVGKGTTFSFTLEPSAKAAEQADPVAPSSGVEAGPRTG